MQAWYGRDLKSHFILKLKNEIHCTVAPFRIELLKFCYYLIKVCLKFLQHLVGAGRLLLLRMSPLPDIFQLPLIPQRENGHSLAFLFFYFPKLRSFPQFDSLFSDSFWQKNFCCHWRSNEGVVSINSQSQIILASFLRRSTTLQLTSTCLPGFSQVTKSINNFYVPSNATSVTKLGFLLDLGQLFKAFGNN